MKPHYKPISSESNLFKVEFQENHKDFYYPWHYHAELELAFIVSGKGIRYVGNFMENFYGEELVLLGSNLPHNWTNQTEEEEPVTAIVVFLKEEFLEKTWMQSIEFEAIKKLLAEMNKGIKVNKESTLRLKPMFLELLKANEFEKLIILLQILQDLATNADYQFLCEQEFTCDINEIEKRRINIVYDYIQKNYLKQITLADISSKINMSEEYFSRFFSKTMKKPFFEFLNEYKINQACKLLIETDKQVSEVCYASGYESITYFYRQFKKFKNCQPKNYRANYRKMAESELREEGINDMLGA
ncbi:AraC family transcriptional regulator [Sphingobacterium mizutaii]|uniref:AraC family transcriptional regulator n=1 Tax=Sphingobacterium mizutaii TaxID=1010 RepID=UPI00162A9E8B|nr:AraC family transcriptional regulator [Sphingobacterium mizutaii]